MLYVSQSGLILCRAMFWIDINGSVWPSQETHRPAGCNTLSLRHPAEQPLSPSLQLKMSSSLSAVYLQQTHANMLILKGVTDLFCSVIAQTTWSGNSKEINKAYIDTKWKNGQKGRTLWCQWSLIIFLRRRGRACGWGWNVCMVFALCLPQATVPPDSLYISLTLLPVTLWLGSSAACSHFWIRH